MSTSLYDLCEVDMLPPGCEIEVAVQLGPNGSVLTVRFQMKRPLPRRWWQRARQETSQWSGWFSYEGRPIILKWASFWEDP